MSDARMVRRLFVALCISSGIFLIAYATRVAYDDMYSSLIPKNKPSRVPSRDDVRNMLLVPAAAVIEPRSTKTGGLGGREVTVLCIVGLLCSVMIWFGLNNIYDSVKDRWLRKREMLGLGPRPGRPASLLAFFRSGSAPVPEAPAPSSVIVNMDDVLRQLRAPPQRLWDGV
ncbi:hypothetical protein V8C35DRAFT_299939 [Trichoderma chlorosporum]